MDEIGKVLIGTSPVLAVVLLLGMQMLATIKDIAASWHNDRIRAEEQREDVKHSLEELTRRVKILEGAQTGEVSPTLAKQ